MRIVGWAFVGCVVAGCVVAGAEMPKQGGAIRRLDGTSMKMADAEAFARKTFEEQHVTGAQIAYVDGGKLVWSAAFGSRRLEPLLPMDTQTTTWAASITKSLFATYVMTLVERGEFALDVPLAQMLAKPLNEYEGYKEKASLLVKDPQWGMVTARMLLSHSSGLQNFATMEPEKKMVLHFKPGTEFLYSGEGMNLLQFVVEQKKGKPLDELMDEAFFKPLGMTRTGLIYKKEFAEDVADRYDATGKFISGTRRFPARGAGSMTASAEDLARFAIALMGDKLVKPATKAEMLKPVLALRELHQFHGPGDHTEGTEGPGVGLAYGTGWGLLTKTKYGPAFFKEGHGDGAQNYMVCFVRRKACVILLTNSDNGELAFRPLLEKIFGETVTPWEWEGYTPSYIEESRKVP